MSKILFSPEVINILKQHDKVIYISEKSISFTTDFRIEIAICKIKYDIIELFESVGINPEVLAK